MATSGYGIVTYEDLYNEFGVSDTALPIPSEQCPTYQQIVSNFPELQITGSYQSNQLVRFKDISFANVNHEITIYNAMPDSLDLESVHVGTYAENGYAYEDDSNFESIGTIYGDDYSMCSVSVPYNQSTFGICLNAPIELVGGDRENGLNWGRSSDEVRGQLQYDTDAGFFYGNLPILPRIYLGTGYSSASNIYGPILIGNGNNYCEFDTEFTQFDLSLRETNGRTLFSGGLAGHRVICSATGGYFPAYDIEPIPYSESWGVKMSDLNTNRQYTISIQVTLGPQVPGYLDFVLVPCDRFYNLVPTPTNHAIHLGMTDNSDGTFTHTTTFTWRPSYDTTLYDRLALGIVLLESDTDYWDWS